MILSRFIRNTKSQNWFGLTLDFVIVVVGIFLAFQIERWYEEKRLAAEEEAHLIALADDFAAAREDIQWVIDRFAGAKEAAQELLSLDQGSSEQITNDGFYSLIADAQRNGNLEPKRQTYDALVATGKLEALQDEQLKDMLGAYYSTVDRRLESRKRWDAEIALVWEPFVNSRLDRIMLIKYAHPDDTADLSPSRDAEHYRELIGDAEFEGVMSKRWHFYRDRGHGMHELFDLTTEIEDKIAENLARINEQ